MLEKGIKGQEEITVNENNTAEAIGSGFIGSFRQTCDDCIDGKDGKTERGTVSGRGAEHRRDSGEHQAFVRFSCRHDRHLQDRAGGHRPQGVWSSMWNAMTRQDSSAKATTSDSSSMKQNSWPRPTENCNNQKNITGPIIQI